MQRAETFGEWLRQRRKAYDLTQEELADRTGCAIETVRKIEAGSRRPSRQMVESLAGQLGVPDEEQPSLIQLARTGQVDETSVILSKPPAEPKGSSLPAPRTSFVGREFEIAALRLKLLQDNVRLVTLTGTPGSGKTRLSVQVGAGLLDDFANGVFFVDLAPVTEPNLVLSTIARVLGLREMPGRPLSDLVGDYLRDKEMLLILDNFEQILAAAPLVADLLDKAPRLKCLVTSREPLHIYGEHQYPVGSLALPTEEYRPSPKEPAQPESVELFVQRARAVRPDFSLTESNAPVVADICRQLDGLPLAIELAAARIRVLTPPALLERLGRRLPVLSGGPKDLPLRQQTLRNAIAWSHDTLSEHEKKLFRRLAVFSGGFTVEAAEEVCDPGGDFSTDVLDLLAVLVDKSLLNEYEMPNGTPRISMLETIREFASEELAASGEEDMMRARHAAYMLKRVEIAEPQLKGPDREVWLDRLRIEVGNVQAALGWCQSDRGDLELGLKLAATLHWFWFFRGQLTVGKKWLERMLNRHARVSPQAVSPPLARALYAVGQITSFCGTYAEAGQFLERSIEAARAAGDRSTLGMALLELGQVRQVMGEGGALDLCVEGFDLVKGAADRWSVGIGLILLASVESWTDTAQSVAHLKQSLPIFREVGDDWGTEWAVESLGRISLLQGDYEDARVKLEEGLRLARLCDDRMSVASTLRGLGDIAFMLDDYPRAADCFRQSNSLCAEVGDTTRNAVLTRYEGHTAMQRGDCVEAARFFGKSLSLAQSMGDNHFVVPIVMSTGCLAAAAGVLEPAARLFGAASVLYGVTSTNPRWIVEEKLYQECLAIVRKGLTPEAFERAWDEGKEYPLEQAVQAAEVLIYEIGTPWHVSD